MYTENTSDAWHIPRYPTRNYCITTTYITRFGPLWQQHKKIPSFVVRADFRLIRIKEEKTIVKPLAGIEPHIFGLLVRRVKNYTTRTNHAGNTAS